MASSTASSARLRARRREQGICIRCPSGKPIGGTAMCGACREEMKTGYERRQRRRYEAGVCAICSKEPRMSHAMLGAACSERLKTKYRTRRGA